MFEKLFEACVIRLKEDLKIIKDSPGVRRKFIDMELCQLNPKYYYNLVQYNKVLNERNSILRNKKGKIVGSSIQGEVRKGKKAKYISKQYNANMKYLGKSVTINDKYNTCYFYNSKDKLINYKRYILASDGKIIGTVLYSPRGKVIRKDLWPAY